MLHEREVSKACMKKLIDDFLYDEESKGMDIDKSWEELHDDGHNLLDRQLVIDIFNELLRDRGIHPGS